MPTTAYLGPFSMVSGLRPPLKALALLTWGSFLATELRLWNSGSNSSPALSGPRLLVLEFPAAEFQSRNSSSRIPAPDLRAPNSSPRIAAPEFQPRNSSLQARDVSRKGGQTFLLDRRLDSFARKVMHFSQKGGWTL